MTIASDLLEQHIQTLVDDNARWQTLISDDILWELAHAPSLGHPAQLSGRKEVVRHATWFVGAVGNLRFFDLNVYALADVQGAVAEVKGDDFIKSTIRMYRQDYGIFLRTVDGKIAFFREYFDPVRAAKALDTRIPRNTSLRPPSLPPFFPVGRNIGIPDKRSCGPVDVYGYIGNGFHLYRSVTGLSATHVVMDRSF